MSFSLLFLIIMINFYFPFILLFQYILNLKKLIITYFFYKNQQLKFFIKYLSELHLCLIGMFDNLAIKEFLKNSLKKKILLKLKNILQSLFHFIFSFIQTQSYTTVLSFFTILFVYSKLVDLMLNLISIFLFPEVFYVICLTILVIYYLYILFIFNNFKFTNKNLVKINLKNLLTKYNVEDIYSLKTLNNFIDSLFLCSIFLYFLSNLIFFFLIVKLTVFLPEYNCFFFALNSFSIDCLIILIKTIVCFFAFIIYLWYSKVYFFYFKPEFTLIFGFSVLFISFILLTYNFMSLLLCVEAYTLCALLLLSSYSSNFSLRLISLKYFLISSFASLQLLFSITFFYGFFGTFSYKAISIFFLFSYNMVEFSLFFYSFSVLLIILFIGLSLKLAIVPFHFWIFDIYDSVPIPILAYIIICSKLFFFTSIFYLFYFIFISFFSLINFLLIITSLITIFVSSIFLLTQLYIKRFLVSIAFINTGFILFSLLTVNIDGGTSFFLYLIFDNIFYLLLILFLNSFVAVYDEELKLKSLCSFFDFIKIKNFSLKFFLIILFFSLSGLPPFGIFFLKYLLLISIISLNNWFYTFFFLIYSCFVLVCMLRPLKNFFFYKGNYDSTTLIHNFKSKYFILNLSFYWSFFFSFLLFLNVFLVFILDFLYLYLDSLLFNL